MKHRVVKSMVGGTALIWVSVAIVLAALANAGQVTPFALIFMLIVLVVRNVVHARRLRFPGVMLRNTLLMLGLGGVYFLTGTLVGSKAGLSLLFVLVAMKALETNSTRDFQVLCLLAWFLALCGLFFEQELVRSLYLGFVCWLIGASLIHFHRDSHQSIRRSLRTGFSLFFQALPVMVLLFLFFPRSYGGFRFNFGHSPRGTTGMSDKLEPGSFSSLTMNQDDVFRVNFPGGRVPAISQMYWRGNVLWQGDLFRWSRGATMYSEPGARRLSGEEIRQEITLEPHGEHWLFGLDRPQTYRADAVFEAGGGIRSMRAINSTLRYEVTSRPNDTQEILLPVHRAAALQLQQEVSGRVKELVNSWRAGGRTDRQVVEAAIRWLRQERFTYSLEPGTYADGSKGFDDFLFNRRTGFCEHYAAAFCTLMRLANIPSRVVIGYLGGEYNPHGQYVIVRQSDAHAWSEVHLDKTGWLRVDPTDVLAPERVTLGIASYLQQQAAGATAGGNFANQVFGLRDWMRDLRLAWDNVNFQWNLRILGFDEAAQRQFFANVLMPFGKELPYGKWHLYMLSGLVILTPVLLLLGFLIRRSQRGRPDVLQDAYALFCRTLASAGCERAPNEGPLHFASRATQAFPENAAQISGLTDLYLKSRYAREPLPARNFTQAVKEWRSEVRLKVPAPLQPSLCKTGKRKERSCESKVNRRQ